MSSGHLRLRTALLGGAVAVSLAGPLLPLPALAGPLVPTTSITPATPVVPAAATLAAVVESDAAPRAAATGRKTKKGAKGQRITVTPVKGLAPFGQTVKVKGRGFSEVVGIYVGLCVRPKRGTKPTPCGGGMDQDGSSQASAWISSNPPPYGRGLAIPYKRGGRFSVTIRVNPMIGSYDCRQVKCAIVARADHLRASDRTWDVVVPVSFR